MIQVEIFSQQSSTKMTKNVINPQYAHGNAKRPQKTQKLFYRTTKSVFKTAKKKKDQLVEVYEDTMKVLDQTRRSKLAPRYIKQIRNAQNASRQQVAFLTTKLKNSQL